MKSKETEKMRKLKEDMARAAIESLPSLLELGAESNKDWQAELDRLLVEYEQLQKEVRAPVGKRKTRGTMRKR